MNENNKSYFDPCPKCGSTGFCECMAYGDPEGDFKPVYMDQGTVPTERMTPPEEKNMKTTTFENSIREVLREFETKAIEYKECSSNELNGDYFKGKADAYEFTVKQLKRAFEWHGLNQQTP